MNNNRTLHPPVGVGILTVLMILVVLMLASFAVMSLLSANADAHLTEKACANVTAYYTADTQAERMVADIALALEDEDWREALSSIGVSVSLQDDSAILFFSVPMDDKDCLCVVLLQPLSGNRPTGEMTRMVWQMMTWEEATSFRPQT